MDKYFGLKHINVLNLKADARPLQEIHIQDCVNISLYKTTTTVLVSGKFLLQISKSYAEDTLHFRFP